MRRAVEDNLQKDLSAIASSRMAIVIALGMHAGLVIALALLSPPTTQSHLTSSLSVVVIEKPLRAKQIKNTSEENQISKPREEQTPRLRPPNSLPQDRAKSDEPPSTTPEPLKIEAEVGIRNEDIDVSILQSEEIASTGQSASEKTHIPSRWALKPPLATDRLKGLGFSQSDIECLTSLEPECQNLRSEVFVEYLLTETELVWTPSRPDTGMPAEFRGLSDQEILEKLGMNYAGGNALLILPGIAIDGPLWDRLHGVNKPCRLQRAITGTGSEREGGIGVRRICD